MAGSTVWNNDPGGEENKRPRWAARWSEKLFVQVNVHMNYQTHWPDIKLSVDFHGWSYNKLSRKNLYMNFFKLAADEKKQFGRDLDGD